LLEADGSLVTKDELLGRVWPGIVVAEENVKTQISALRKALGGTAISSKPISAAATGSPVWPARIPRPTAVSIQREQSCGPTEPSFRGSAGNRSV